MKLLPAIALAALCGAANLSHAQTATPPQVACCAYHYQYAGSTRITLPARATPNWGTTVAEVQSRFAYTVYLNFLRSPNLDAMISGMDPMMLARLSTELAANDTAGYTQAILNLAAQRVSALNLHRLASAFGPTRITMALTTEPAMVRSYLSSPTLPPTPFSTYWWQSGLGAGVTDAPGQTVLYDLFLNSYTGGTGGASAPSLKAAAQYYTRVVRDSPVVVVVVVVAAVFAILDSPSAQQLAATVNQWIDDQLAYQTVLFGHLNLPPDTITMPTPYIVTPPIPDLPVPVLPPIDDLDFNFFTLECTNYNTCLY